MVSLTINDVDNMRQLYDSDNRTAMYLSYYEIAGKTQALTQAQISSFSGFKGAVADCANQKIQSNVTSLYPEKGVIAFSKEIAGDFLERLEKNIESGGTGIFTNDEIFEFAKQKWVEKGLGNYFPGNILTAPKNLNKST